MIEAPEELEKLKEIAGTNDKIVAIGEIGLNYYYDCRGMQNSSLTTGVFSAKNSNSPIHHMT